MRVHYKLHASFEIVEDLLTRKVQTNDYQTLISGIHTIVRNNNNF